MMMDLLRTILGVLLVASLGAIVAYAVIFLTFAARAVLKSPQRELPGSRRDSLADELDEFLAGLWAAESGHPSRGAERRGRLPLS